MSCQKTWFSSWSSSRSRKLARPNGSGTICWCLAVQGDLVWWCKGTCWFPFKPINCVWPVFQITASPSALSRQLWGRTGNFFKTFLQFYVYDLRFKAAGLTTYLIEFWTLVWRVAPPRLMYGVKAPLRIWGNDSIRICGNWIGIYSDSCMSHRVTKWEWVSYNMTVWILAWNDINFSMAAGLIRLHMPGVK